MNSNRQDSDRVLDLNRIFDPTRSIYICEASQILRQTLKIIIKCINCFAIFALSASFVPIFVFESTFFFLVQTDTFKRRTHIDQLKKRINICCDANEIVNDWFKRLINQLFCTNDIYINEHNYCWINYEDIHYKINILQRIIWTAVILSEKNNAFIDYSFHLLLYHLFLK